MRAGWYTVFAAPGFTRLWVAGGIANAMLWLEVLAAGLFTLDATGSGFAVAVVSAARAMPLLVAGALVGVVSDALDRKRIVLGGLLLTAASSGSVALMAALHVLRPWHLAAASLVSGFVYATEMPARRRLVSECAGPALLARAVAFDSLTNFATRCLGPLAGGAAFGAVGLAGTFGFSAALSLVGAVVVAGVPHAQERRALAWRHALEDLAEGFAFARRSGAIRALLGITLTMNLFGFSYASLVPTIGQLSFRLSPAGVGLLGAAEPAGALLWGLVMAAVTLPGRPLRWLAGGVALLLSGLAIVPLLPPLPPVLVVLVAGGVGTALFVNHQTTIVLDATPVALRSRVMGLVTVCIGSWPLGMVLAGALTTVLPPLGALAALALAGLSTLLAVVLAFLPA